MKFVEETEGTWTAIQLKAVEMEIEQQKRDWEANRMAAMQQEELERAKVEQEDNELLTFSREDALNKVNINRSNKKKLGNKRDRVVRASENQNHSVKNQTKIITNNSNNNNSSTRNGLVNETLEQNSKNNKSGESSKSPKQRSIEISVNNNSSTINRRYTRNLVNKSQTDDVNSNSTPRALRRRIKSNSIKSSRSNSLNSHRSNEKARSTSESTTTTDKESTTQRTTPDDSDSDVSLDVMIDSNDVNDSDSNSTNNHHQQNVVRAVNLNFDSTSQDDDTLMNDVSNDHTPQKDDDHNVNSDSIKMTSSPRTRSRGTVKINLWTLDESPILPANKRHKSNNQNIQKNSSLNDTLTDAEISLKADFGIVKELKVEVALYVPKTGPKKQPTIIKKITPKRQLNVKNNQTLDSWLTKTPNSISPSVTAKKIAPLLPVDPLAIDDTVTVKHDTDVKPILRSRRNTTVINYSDTNKTL